MRTLLYHILCFFLLYSMFSCNKKSELEINSNTNNISPVIADNFSLSSFHIAVQKSKFSDLLNSPGPYTVLAPTNVAFVNKGYGNIRDLIMESHDVLSRLTRYHILDGAYDFKKLPFMFSQELESRGGKMFLTKWVYNKDTVISINGSRVFLQPISASNGSIWVIDKVLETNIHQNLFHAISADPELTLFARVIFRAGLQKQYEQKMLQTVFVPNNKAMIAFGLNSLEEIDKKEEKELASFVKSHSMNDARFLDEFIFTIGSSKERKQLMNDERSILLKLVKNRDGFESLVIRGIANSSDIKIIKPNTLTGNGVLHIVDSVIKTQP
ncbi:fasciclin domain-containing protein [Sphingobacterium kyonggiense]